MNRFAWSEQVATLSAMLDTLGDRVTDGDPGTTGLVEFKGALDDLRMRSWTLLMATNSDDPCVTVMRTSRRTSAIAVMRSVTARHSDRAPRKNFCRAGVL
jgi:hypothetical protein